MRGKAFAAALLMLCAAGAAAQKPQRGERDNGRAWLGVTIQDVTPRLARERDLPVKTGALVNGVSDESPASRGGICENDVIVEFNGKPVEDADDLVAAVGGARTGTKANVALYRGSEKRSIDVTLADAPRHNHAMFLPGPMRIPPIPRIRLFRSGEIVGLTLSDLRGQLGEYFQAPDGRGVLVEEVGKESAAERSGFRAGDVIIRAGKDRVETTEDLTDACSDLRTGDSVVVSIVRRGSPLSLTLRGEDGERWRRPRSMREEMRVIPPFDRNGFRMEMDRLKEELRSVGSRIRAGMDELRKALREAV